MFAFLLWEHQHMRKPAQGDFLRHQSTRWEKCALLPKSTWQSARGFFPSVQTKEACKQRLLNKFLWRIPWIFWLIFPFNAILSRDVSFRCCFVAIPLKIPSCARNFLSDLKCSPTKEWRSPGLYLSLSPCLFQVPAIFPLMYFECPRKDIPIINLFMLWRFFSPA